VKGPAIRTVVYSTKTTYNNPITKIDTNITRNVCKITKQ